jgi:hydrophobic/amphiphilic exporter-1 (mainly G- bacteria), HAE1 family
VSRLTQIAVSRRSVTLLLAGALFLTGIYAWGNLQQELLPDIEFPVITVIATYPGAGAADVTDQVTKPIEQAISSVARLTRTQSTSANSISVVVATFSFGTNVKDARAAIEQNLANVGLPQGVTPQVTALNINQSPVIVASIGSRSAADLAVTGRIVRTDIVPALQGLDGVSSVDVTGGLEQRLTVTLDSNRLAVAGASVQQVVGLLQANNLTLPAGQLPSAGTSIPVSTIGTIGSLDDVRNLVVKIIRPNAQAAGGAGPGVPGAGGATGGIPRAQLLAMASLLGLDPANLPAVLPDAIPVTIGMLGNVELSSVATTGYARTDGNPSITLTISKASGANTVSVADAVTAALAAAQTRNPDLRITTVSDLSNFIKESRDGLVREGGLGALFAILTIFLFLFSLRSTVVAAVSIPISILAALTLMLATGISMNIMTLGGLAVAVGRVVDDAIVVLENIYRHRARGDDKVTAVREGAREVAGAITASTATTVMVFLPLGFVGGLVSQFFLPFALTVTFALLASLACALTVVPVLAYFLVDKVQIQVDETGEPKRSIWVRIYTPTIRFALRSRWTKWGIVVAAGVLFFASLALVPGIPTQFINAGGEKNLTISISPPSGANSAAVLARTVEAEKILDGLRPTVQLIQSTVPGEGDTGLQTLTAAFSGRSANSASIWVRLDNSVDLKAYTKKLATDMAPIKADGYDVAVSEATGFSAGGINVIVSGADPTQVASVSKAVVGVLQQNADLINVKSDLAQGAPAVEITVDPNKAIAAGLTAAQVAADVRTVLVPQRATRVQMADQPILDLYVRVDPAQVDSVAALRALPVGIGQTVPLGSIADVQQVSAQGSITRIDERPASSISAEITSANTGAVSQAVALEIDRLRADGTIPFGVEVRLAGVTQLQTEAFSGLFVSMAVAILLVYLMMVLTFNSLITPFVIMFSLPLATIGAFPALLLTGRPIGISALIGFLMLIGIVVTNAIVLLDLVERLRARGEPTTEALVEGGRTRVRPILMTAIATILALTPLAAGFNQGSIIAAELGTVVIGGLFSSTFLTLIVVPVVYSLVDGGKVGVARRLAARADARSEEGPAEA